MQLKVFKQILGVHKQTTNSGVLLELGRATLELECIKFSTKNWERIRKGMGNAILIDTFKDATKEDLPWLRGILSNLEKNNLIYFYSNQFPNRYPFIYKKLHTAMLNRFQDETLTTIKSNKLRSYALFKTEPGKEVYLNKVCW